MNTIILWIMGLLCGIQLHTAHYQKVQLFVARIISVYNISQESASVQDQAILTGDKLPLIKKCLISTIQKQRTLAQTKAKQAQARSQESGEDYHQEIAQYNEEVLKSDEAIKDVNDFSIE